MKKFRFALLSLLGAASALAGGSAFAGSVTVGIGFPVAPVAVAPAVPVYPVAAVPVAVAPPVIAAPVVVAAPVVLAPRPATVVVRTGYAYRPAGAVFVR